MSGTLVSCPHVCRLSTDTREKNTILSAMVTHVLEISFYFMGLIRITCPCMPPIILIHRVARRSRCLERWYKLTLWLAVTTIGPIHGCFTLLLHALYIMAPKQVDENFISKYLKSASPPNLENSKFRNHTHA